MKILGMGVPELLIILVVILLIFGPKNLPKLGSALGKTEEDGEEGRQEEGRVTSLLRQHQARTVVRPLRCAGAPPMYKRENRNHYG